MPIPTQAATPRATPDLGVESAWLVDVRDGRVIRLVEATGDLFGANVLGSFDQWVIDVTTGDRRLIQRGLEFCGGCDGVPGPTWSASSRSFYFSDVVARGKRFFITDMRTRSVRQLAHQARAAFDVRAWAPLADVLLYSTDGGATVMEDLAAGSRIVLEEVDWPAAFDGSGAYLYSPGWVDHEAPGRVTRVFDARTRRSIASLAGPPVPRAFVGVGGPAVPVRSIVGVGATFVAALQGAPGCDGIAIYRGSSRVTCATRMTRPLPTAPRSCGARMARACSS